jgi:uncharacterized protein (TIGR02421 family)
MDSMPRASDRSLKAIQRAAPILDDIAKRTKLLDTLQWPKRVEEQFFAESARKLPVVTYAVDRDAAQTAIRDLRALIKELDRQDPVQQWLARIADSYADGNRLLLAAGTREFHAISTEVYGGPRSLFDADTTNLDLAEHLKKRMSGEREEAPPSPSAPDETPRRGASNARAPHNDDDEPLDARAFARALEEQANAMNMPIKVVVDDDLCSRVVAGRERVRVREGATFRRSDVLGVFVHEIETHALTAQNGAAQPHLPFLAKGGPRSTRTQEGLAVFAEFDVRTLTVPRMRGISLMVRMVAAAEDGASFLDLYRMRREQGLSERNAFSSAMRVCRGGLVEGGAPFTKDASYLAGFTEVYSFLQLAARGGARDIALLLIAGRIALEDLSVLDELRRRDILKPPAHVPRWLAAWDRLLPVFAFTSFLGEINLRQVARKHRDILARIEDDVS